MFETISDSEMIEKAKSVIEHLKIESKYLDSVIDSSLEMQSLLRDRQSSQGVPGNSRPSETENADAPSTDQSLPTKPDQQITDRLTEIREQIAREFMPVIEGRRKMVETMNSINPNKKQTPSVTALTLKVDEPHRGKLKKLRNEIRSKLNQVQSISMGSQAILLYTMDFYHRLLTGLTQNQSLSSYYNSSGRSHNNFDVNLIETNG